MRLFLPSHFTFLRLFKKGAVALVCALAGFLLTGCAGYHLGPSNGETAGSRSVEVKPFMNLSLEPWLTEYVSNSLRKQVQRDGTFRLDTHGEGDLLITGTITQFERHELGYQPRDVITPVDYTLVLIADVVVIDRDTGKTNNLGRIAGHSAMRIGADMTSAEREAIPMLAEDFARNLISRLADGSW